MNTQNLPATTSDRLNALKERAKQTTEIKNWQPVAGETLAGVIIGSSSFNHPLYGQQKTMLLQDDSGAVTSVILTNYLMTGLKNQNAERGDLCAVTFHGQDINPKTKHRFNKYSVLIDKA